MVLGKKGDYFRLGMGQKIQPLEKAGNALKFHD